MKFGWREVEVIGPHECPIMFRWTLIDAGFAKLLLHEFLPGADDADPHDHPRSFLTFVYAGGYIDVTPCPVCGGASKSSDPLRSFDCPGCFGLGERYEDVLSPAIRFRRAQHAHITRSEDGAKSLVLMGPERREWGFWRAGTWVAFREYLSRFGPGHRCP